MRKHGTVAPGTVWHTALLEGAVCSKQEDDDNGHRRRQKGNRECQPTRTIKRIPTHRDTLSSVKGHTETFR